VAVLTTAGCGLPQGTTPLEPDPSGVPYRLLSPTEAGPTTAQRGPRTTTPDVYLVTSDGRLVPVEAPVRRDGLEPVTRDVLTRLTSGPTATERASGLGSVLGPETRLTLAGVADGTATVALDLGTPEPGAARLPLAIAQVVLSTTSVEGVDRVQLVRDGAPVQVPRPDGSLTSDPLTAADYDELLSSSPVGSKAKPT
ncbi:MAG: Lipoprotein LpqB, GerMN domain, partial [Humibacillus sp.]|nr:Lipoprotein LpqB, GerMN domain [Humibacillus sp.]